jgi:hypothetical protein
MANHIDEFFNDEFVPNFPPNESFEYTMIPTKKLEAYETLLKSMFAAEFNANDFFMWATAWSITINEEDFYWMRDHIMKYGDEGQSACLAYIQNIEPMEPYLTDTFKEAIKELVDRKQEVYSDFDYGHGFNTTGPYRTIKED